MRARRSTAVQSTLIISALLHGSVLAAWVMWNPSARPSPSHELEVYTVSESEMASMSLDGPPVALPEVSQTAVANSVKKLSESELASLPHDREPLPEQKPSDTAVTKANGQIVEIAPPDEAQPPPDKADYLAAANVRVTEEQASRQFRLNPDVLAPSFSDKSSLAHTSPGDAKARMRGEQNGQHGDPGGATGQQSSMRQPEKLPPPVSQQPPQLLASATASTSGPSKASTQDKPTTVAMLPGPSASNSAAPAAMDKARADILRKPEPAPEPVVIPQKAPEAPANQTQPSHAQSILDEWGMEPQQSVPPAKTPARNAAAALQPSPLLAKLDASLRPTATALPTPSPEALGARPPATTSNRRDAQVASIAPPSSPSSNSSGSGNGSGNNTGNTRGQGQGGGDGGTAAVTFRQGELRGAPSNDRLDEKRGESTLLNAREFKYFGYMQLIRRQVNFYWSQSLDNITSVQERLSRTEYTTVLNITLDTKGNLKQLSMVRSCGVKKFDEATLQAFRIAAPFPPPPEGLLNASDEASLPEFAFTVNLSAPAPRYSGIDPRSNVLFPGIVRP